MDLSTLDWKSLVRTVAPAMATAVGTPAAGMVVAALSNAIFGNSDASQEQIATVIQGGHLTPDQLAAVTKADNDFKVQMAQIAADLQKAQIDDRKDSRAMQIATRSNVPAILTIIVTIGYFAILVGMLAGWLHVDTSPTMFMMLGSLTTAWGVVMAFWFGTTLDSGRKTELLAQSKPAA